MISEPYENKAKDAEPAHDGLQPAPQKTHSLAQSKEASPQIDLRNVTMRYGSHTACSNISFSIRPGEYWLILGENGSGKSTLLKGVLQLMPLVSGVIDRHHGPIGYVPQQSDIEYGFPATVLEVVRSGCVASMGIVYSQKEKARAMESLARLGIEHLALRSYHHLSGGQRQRVLLARALCAAESILVLDEPDAGLDPVISAKLYAAIRDLNRQGMTILMVTHNPEAVIDDASDIVHLGHGVLFCGSPEAYRADQASRGYAR